MHMDMESEFCPQCKELIKESSKRIIKDSCGHEKCRFCLLKDVENCQQCVENDSLNSNYSSSEHISSNFENTHITVITCNKILSSVDFKKDDNVELQKKMVLDNNETEIYKAAQPIVNATTEKFKSKLVSQKRRYERITVPSHVTIAGTPPTFTCTICKSEFKTKGHVKYHIFCSKESKPYVCEICNKSFILKSQLTIHNRIHSEEKPYICEICQKGFRETGKLKRHMVIHTDKRPHVCDKCGKNFKTPHALNFHRIIHSGEKPYSCKHCKMRFNNSSNLKKHISSHSDDKTHMCEQCGNKFKQKWALTVHRRSHVRKRDFVCKICSKAFINNKDLKRHETIHLDIKIYLCGLCSMAFRRKDNLRRHFRNAHPDEKPEIIKRDVQSSDKLEMAVVDNPNAINVITTSSISRKIEDVNDKPNYLPRTCMNGPLKLAFKTSAFKKNYNINRDHPFDSNSREVSTSKSLPTHHTSPSRIFPSVYTSPSFSVDEYYANRPHIIKNIKFKIPTNYPPENEGVLKTFMHAKHMDEEQKRNAKRSNEECNEKDKVEKTSSVVMTVKKPTDQGMNTVGVTSVIVNSSDPKTIHWRRKMSLNNS